MQSVQEEAIQFQSENQPVSNTDAATKIQGRWNQEEHLKFLKAIVCYGKDWRKVEEYVAVRTGAQVRSHAQKYFLKISKIIKDRKKIKGKKMPEITETELQLKDYFTCHPLTSQTPKEIIDLLRIEKVGIKEIIQENCNGSQRIRIQQLLAPTIKPEKRKVQKTKNQQTTVNIFESIQNEVTQVQEDSSFFARLIRNYKEYFFNGGNFSAFIDYGSESKKEKSPVEEQQTVSHRKSSFNDWIA